MKKKMHITITNKSQKILSNFISIIFFPKILIKGNLKSSFFFFILIKPMKIIIYLFYLK